MGEYETGDPQVDLGAGGGYDGSSSSGQAEGTSGNPAWTNLLSVLPEDLHEKVTPVLSQWDKQVQQRFETVQSEWNDWKPFKEQYKPEDVKWGLSLAQSLAQSPKETYEAIGEYLKTSLGIDPFASSPNPSGQGQQEPSTSAAEDPYALKFQEVQQQLDLVARAVLAKEQKDSVAAAEAQLDVELKAAKDKYGEYDEKFVLARLQAGDSVEGAVKAYTEIAEQAAKRARPKFSFLGSGGGVPATPVDPRKMTESARNKLAVEMLMAARGEMD